MSLSTRTDSNANTTQNLFVRGKSGADRTGVLMRLEEDEHTRYVYEVWFEYTRQAMNDIREGTMLAVPNYSTTRTELHMSILEVTSIKPIHYAIGEAPDGFPGFVMEAAKNAAEDWTGQDDEPTEDTTTIRCSAIPTGLEMLDRPNSDLVFQQETNIPMVGAIVRILDTIPTEKVVNRDIDMFHEKETVFRGGTLARDQRVTVYVRSEEFVKLHFGVFGFTGSGKSNLMSTYISKLLHSKQVIKVVLFDLMSEYTVLLLDELLRLGPRGRILTLGRYTLPEGVFKFINLLGGAPSLDDAAKQFDLSTLLPKSLLGDRHIIVEGLRKLLSAGAIRYFNDAASMTVWDIFFTDRVPWAKARQKAAFLDRQKFVKDILRRVGVTGSYDKVAVTPELAKRINEALDAAIGGTKWEEGDFGNHQAQVAGVISAGSEHLAAATTLEDVVRDLASEDGSSLWVVQAHNPDEMRDFANRLGNTMYESRRQSGRITPLVSMVFDEADEFIPREASGTQALSKAIVETLARRGRKFGMGVGIATQRARHLDTNIMAQPHTYLVSKLPRSSDREVVAEAFGISDDMFRQTFKFRPGDWLLVSHDATGLKAIPVPIRAENANERVKANLAKLLSGQKR